jgi:hypothetical protein
MAFEVLVRNLLLNATPAGDRIHPLLRPQASALPAITYQRITVTRRDPLDRATIGAQPIPAHPIEPPEVRYVRHDPLANARLQIDCWALSYSMVKELADTVYHRLNGYAAPPGPAWPCLTGIRALPQDLDDYEPETQIYRVSQDYSIWWEELEPEED